MSEQIRQESPLIERTTAARRDIEISDPGATVRELPFLGYVNLRGDAGDPGFTGAVSKVAEIELPTQPNTFVDGDRVRAIWLGPDEWYLVGVPGTEAQLVDALEDALAGTHHAVNDLSSGLTTLELSGPKARDVLDKGCTLDLHPRSFGAGQCAQTLVSHAGILLRFVDDAPTFELTVRRSFADYLWAWLEDAADEFGLRVTE